MQHMLQIQSFVNSSHIDGDGWADIFSVRPLKRYSFQMTGKLLLIRHVWRASWQNTKASKGFNHASSWCMHFNQSVPGYTTKSTHFIATDPNITPHHRDCWSGLREHAGLHRGGLRIGHQRKSRRPSSMCIAGNEEYLSIIVAHATFRVYLH